MSRAAVRFLPAAILVAGFIVAAMGASARAATFGQLGEAWGQAGTGAGQLFKPGIFGVDPRTGSVYAGDTNAAGTKFRIQMFTETGEPKASVEFSKKDEASGKLLALAGIAVDPDRERLYVIEACRVVEGSTTCSLPSGARFAAVRIHAFKTTPSEGTLPSAGTFTMPSGENELYSPTSIAVDPVSGDLILLGEDAEENAGHKVVQRVSPTGTLGERFVDSANVLKALRMKPPTSLAVGPDGVVFMLSGISEAHETGAKSTRAWQLPREFSASQPAQVPGFAAAAEAEGWTKPLNVQNSAGRLLNSPEIAISPDGSTLYWKEEFKLEESSHDETLIRAYSLAEGKTRTVYGGGTSRCRVQTSSAGIGVAGEGASEELLAFDYGPEQASPPYGAKVVRFGQGGTGCPTSVARFSVDGRDEDGVEVDRGDVVNLDATSSELANKALPSELIWTFGDGQKQVVKCEEAEAEECLKPAAMTISHKYAAAGEFTIKLEIKLEEAAFGNPQPVQRTLIVKSPAVELSVFKAGTGSGTVTSAPAGINCGSKCAAEFEAGKVVTLTPVAAAGSEFAGWSGACSGAGACQVTMGEAESVTASFDLEAGTPPPSEFQLTVFKAGTGSGTVTSSPAGIGCGNACVAKFPTGALVTLTPVAAAGSEFKGWGGGCAGAGACQVTMSEAKSVSASFEPEAPPPPALYRLTVTKTGAGSGTVASSRAGIFCGGKCEKEYEDEENVTLIPTPASGSTFAGWSGGGCAGTGVCRLTMNTAKSVTATFNVVFPPASELTAAIAPLPDAGARPKARPKHPAGKKAAKKCGKTKGKKRARCTKKTKGKKGKAHHHGSAS
jgi:hypothetical protein